MTEAAKDLDHYLNNLDELGDLSDDQIEALANPQGTATEAPAEDKGDTESAAAPGSTADVQANEDDQQQPEGILARDGKHIIPFARLEAAEQRVRDYAKQLADLQNAKAAGTPSEESTSQATEGLLSDDELTELETELPALAKVIRAQQAQLTTMAGQVATLSKGQQTEEGNAQAEAAQEWDAAIKGNPKAAYLDAALAPDVGERFVNAAAALYPNWSAMPMSERAAAIVRQYEAVHGEIKVTAVATQPAGKPAVPDVKAPAIPDVPISMSGIPGGSAPAVDEAAALLSKTGAELTHDFMQMSSEAIEAAVNRL
jgi:hypothetical protein